MYQTYTNLPQPQATPNTVGAFNNAMATAQASADPRFNMKEWDRNGVSRGRGTQAMAGIKAANSMADGMAKAYQIPMGDAVSDSQNSLAYQQQRENFGLGTSSLSQQNDYANALAALQRQQAALTSRGNVLGGLLGGSNWLDSFVGT